MTTWIDKPGIAPPEFVEVTAAAVMTLMTHRYNGVWSHGARASGWETKGTHGEP